MTTDQLVLALPEDVTRVVDHTAANTEIESDVFLGSQDDRETLRAMIEDAEDEFRAATNADMRVSRMGTPGSRETFEQVTYSIDGHRAFKQNYTGVSSDYRPTEVHKRLENGRVLPFDSAEGDAAYLYRGMAGDTGTGDTWEEITDEENETWVIVDHRAGEIQFHPILLLQSMIAGRQGVSVLNNQLRELRIAISYRYGSLGGDRSRGGLTELSAQLGDVAPPTTLSIADAARLPTGEAAGTILLRVGTEYVRAVIDQTNDELTITTRGARGTDRQSWDSGTSVHYVPPSVIKAVAARAGMDWVTSGKYNEYLPDADDALNRNDVLDQLRNTYDTTVQALS
jgi:hypothetical protein